MPLTIETERLHLRPLTDDDRAEFIRVHESSEEHFAPWVPGKPDGTWDQIFDKALGRVQRRTKVGGLLPLTGFVDEGSWRRSGSGGRVRRYGICASLASGGTTSCSGMEEHDFRYLTPDTKPNSRDGADRGT